MNLNSSRKNVGILGGGQLARMLALAAHPLGLRPVVFVRYPDECAIDVVAEVHRDRGDVASLRKFCARCDLVTIENEWVDLGRLARAAGRNAIFPSIATLLRVQDKLEQKRNLRRAGIPTLPFELVRNVADLERARRRFGPAIVLKKSRFGYDGRGTYVFDGGQLFIPAEFAWVHAGFTGYAEPLARFRKEIAVVVARSSRGEIRAYPVVESRQEGGMCRWTVAPAGVPARVAASAIRIASNVIRAFRGVGVFGIEMFWMTNDRPDEGNPGRSRDGSAAGGGRGGELVVNEIAPRVHNTGHFSLDACRTSQFEQHWRAVLGLPLGGTDLIAPAAAMVNVIGRTRAAIPPALPIRRSGLAPDAWVHWYRKSGPACERKIGHVNAIAGTRAKALALAQRVRNAVRI